MHPLPPGGLYLPRFAPIADSGEALLRLLEAEPPAWPELAETVLRDPALCHALLAAAPLEGWLPGSGLATALEERLATLGPELLRAWLLILAWDGPPIDRSSAEARRTRLGAECARHLAQETHRADPDEAFLAGLWHELGARLAHRLPLPPSATPAPARAPQAALGARLAADCGAPPPLVDAIELQSALEETVAAAHPLARLLWAAHALAGEDWQARLDACARMTGLSTPTLASLRTDLAYLVGPEGSRPTSLASPSAGTLPGPLAGGATLRGAALAGLLRGSFADIDAEAAAARLAAAFPLLFSRAAPLVAVVDGGDLLRPLPSAATGPARWFAELGLRLDDPTSAVALAARSGRPGLHPTARDGPARSVHDWQIARWLGAEGLACLPLTGVGCPAVAVFGAGPDETPEGDPALMIELLRAAIGAVRAAARRDEERAALAGRIGERYREHARRLAHEAGNPVSVIKNYLDMMVRRSAADAPQLGRDAPLIDAELDRIAALLGRLAELPVDAPEAARCDAAEVLGDLHRLYGESLFAARGIRFDVRPGDAPAPVAMPASALKQVLANLFRNAAEALQPGGRFAVAVAGRLSMNGAPCVELRLVDNGPGLPPERLDDPFAARASGKGGDHQGVGLAMVRDVLAQWNCTVLCRSQPGAGTSFQIFVPLDQSG